MTSGAFEAVVELCDAGVAEDEHAPANSAAARHTGAARRDRLTVLIMSSITLFLECFARPAHRSRQHWFLSGNTVAVTVLACPILVKVLLIALPKCHRDRAISEFIHGLGDPGEDG